MSHVDTLIYTVGIRTHAHALLDKFLFEDTAYTFASSMWVDGSHLKL